MYSTILIAPYWFAQRRITHERMCTSTNVFIHVHKEVHWNNQFCLWRKCAEPFLKSLAKSLVNILEPEKCHATRLGNMGRHGKVIESNQEPRLRTSDTGLMSVIPTWTVQGLIFTSCCLDLIIRNSVLSSLIFSLFWHIHFLMYFPWCTPPLPGPSLKRRVPQGEQGVKFLTHSLEQKCTLIGGYTCNTTTKGVCAACLLLPFPKFLISIYFI